MISVIYRHKFRNSRIANRLNVALFSSGLLMCATVAQGQPPPPIPSNTISASEVPPEEPDVLAYEEGRAVPYGYRLRRVPRTGLIIAGASILGSAYLLGLPAGSYDSYRLIPVAGPFVSLFATREHCEVDCALFAGAESVLLLNGVAQTTGAVLLILGLTLETTYLERTSGVGVRVLPTRVGQAFGIGAFGQF